MDPRTKNGVFTSVLVRLIVYLVDHLAVLFVFAVGISLVDVPVVVTVVLLLFSVVIIFPNGVAAEDRVSSDGLICPVFLRKGASI